MLPRTGRDTRPVHVHVGDAVSLCILVLNTISIIRGIVFFFSLTDPLLHPEHRACTKGRKTRRALSLLRVVRDKGLKMDTYFYTAAIDGESGSAVPCLVRSSSFPSGRSHPLPACAKGNLWREALELLDEMKESGIEASEVTYR